MKRLERICVLLILAAGCADSATDRSAFDTVQSDVLDRTGGMRVQWNTGSQQDAEAEAAVARLLEGELSTEDAVQIALLNNRSLQATFEDIGIGQADLVAAGLIKNPVLDGDILFSTAGGGTGVELTLLQDVLDILWIPLRKKVAQANLDAATTRVTAQVIDLWAQVRRAHYQLVAANQMLGPLREIDESRAASFEFARRLRAAGNITELELSRIRAEHEQSKLQLADAELDVIELRERLNALMGLWGAPAQQWTIPASLPDVAADEPAIADLERRAVEKSLALAEAKADLTTVAAELGVVNASAWFEELELGAKGERDEDGNWGVGPAFTIPIPLFDQGQARTAAAQARLRQAQQMYFATAVEVRAQARAAAARMALARDRLRYFRQVVSPLQDQILDQAQRHYNAMDIGIFGILRAKEQQIDAQVQNFQAIRDYWLARTRLDVLLAGGSVEIEASPARRVARQGEAPDGDH